MDTTAIQEALADFRQALVADGFDLRVNRWSEGHLQVEVFPGPEPCWECLLPTDLLQAVIEQSLEGLPEVREVEVVPPEGGPEEGAGH